MAKKIKIELTEIEAGHLVSWIASGGGLDTSYARGFWSPQKCHARRAIEKIREAVRVAQEEAND